MEGEFRLKTASRHGVKPKFSAKTKKKQSNLWLTINTNKRIESDSKFKEFVTEYDNVLNELFDTAHQFKMMGENMIRFGRVENRKWIPTEGKWDKSVIGFVRVDGVIEEGGTKIGGRIHSHHLIQITHNTSLQLDCRKIEAFINQKMAHLGVKGSYAHAKVVNQDYVNLLDYMGKGVVTDDELLHAIKEQLY
jgi:hypothetical protein